jgi:hypothetical protein
LQGLGLALRQAALAGNATAIDGLALIAASNNKAARDNALRTLKDAALTRHHPKAMEALNHLGF